MAKVGRPPIMASDPKAKATFEVMMGIPFVEKDQICAVFDCSRSTLERWIRKEYKCNFDALKQLKKGGLKLKLAAKQYEMACIKNSVPMAIFLGKQREWLNQSDKQEIASENKVITILIDKQDENL